MAQDLTLLHTSADDIHQLTTADEVDRSLHESGYRSSVDDGCLTVRPGSQVADPGGPRRLELQAGDVVLMHPNLLHCSTLNGGHVRYATYFRLLRAVASRVGASYGS